MAKDKYSLPEGDACYSTLEAYKHYTADATEDTARAYWYREYGGRIEQWRQCCPELQERVDKLRPAKLDVEALKKITLPAAIATQESPCFKYLQFNAAAPAGEKSLGEAWFKHREAFSYGYFEKQYSGLANDLHACCVTKFDGCLQAAQEQFIARGKPTEGAVEACVQRWSPEHQKPLPAGSVPADDPRAKAASPEWVARSQCDEEIKKSVAQSTDISGKATARTAAETRDTASRLKRCDTVTADLGKEVDRWRQAAGRQGDLQGQLEQVRGELQAAAARPGLAEFAAFPAGPASGEIALCGAGAVAVGWVFGLLGRGTRRSKLLSGAVSAGLSLLVYLGAVALLPDTRLPHLLLALTAAVLFAALRTLGRAYVLLRQQRQTP